MPASHPPRAEEARQDGRWLFYRASAEGRPIFSKELDKLPDQAVAALIVLMEQYRAGQVPSHDVKQIRGDIFELRWRQGNNQFRVLFFRWGPHSVALLAFQKKQQKTPKAQIATAIGRQKIWKETFGESPPL